VHHQEQDLLMTVRRNDRPGRGGERGGDDFHEDTRPDVIPATRALVVPRRGSLLVPEAGMSLVAAPLPVGMAVAEQLDGFRELRTRLLSMAAASQLTYFTTLVVPMCPNSGASFVARNLAAA